MPESRWVMLAVLFLARTAMGYQFQSIGSASPFIVSAFVIDYAMLGALIGLYKLPGIVLALPAGFLGRRFGDKEVAVVGLALMAGGGVLIAVWDSYATALAGRAISGAGAVLLNVLAAKMIADWFAGKEMVVAMAILVNSWPFGIAIGLASQAGIVATYSLRAMLLFVAASCVLATILVMLCYRRPQQGEERRGAAPASSGLSGTEFGLVTLSALVWLLFNACLILVVSYAPSFLAARGLSPGEAGWLVSIGTWLGLAAVPLGGYLVQRWIAPDVFMVACFVLAGALTMMIPWSGMWTLSFIGFGIIAWAPAGAIYALPFEVLRPALRGPGIGLFLTYYYLGIGLLSPVAGYLRDRTGDPGAPLIFAGALMLAACACLGLFRLAQLRLVRPV